MKKKILRRCVVSGRVGYLQIWLFYTFFDQSSHICCTNLHHSPQSGNEGYCEKAYRYDITFGSRVFCVGQKVKAGTLRCGISNIIKMAFGTSE